MKTRREHRLVEFKLFHPDGTTSLVDVPELDLDRSKDDFIDVATYLAKQPHGRYKDFDRLVRTGRRFDERNGNPA